MRPTGSFVAELTGACSGLEQEAYFSAQLSDIVFEHLDAFDTDSGVIEARSLLALRGELATEAKGLHDTGDSLAVMKAYACLLAATTIDRRLLQFGEFVFLMNDPDILRTFSGLDAYRMLTAESLMYQGRIDPSKLKKAWSACIAGLRQFSEHHGAQNLMVEINLGLLEAFPDSPEWTDWLAQAELANEASLRVGRSGNAKYLAHRGMLSAYRGDLDNAMRDIREAISTERPTRWDYAARLAHYESLAAQAQSIVMALRFRQHLAEANQRTEEQLRSARHEMEGARAQLLTLTGLLAAVVAIVVINTGIAARLTDRNDAVAVVLLGTGSVLVGFSLLISLVLDRSAMRARLLAVTVALGCAMIVVGVVLP